MKCPTCSGSGLVGEMQDCVDCSGDGSVMPAVCQRTQVAIAAKTRADIAKLKEQQRQTVSDREAGGSS